MSGKAEYSSLPVPYIVSFLKKDYQVDSYSIKIFIFSNLPFDEHHVNYL